ncbi:hypothetical protein SteCoe_29614 [Stentor coeruleus]|uniref:Uncharacterized protein n=1 Tax=Stentor coeruleus TaxID=5963 RepID=A0A1R2B5I9_9CILI|nr:hypothetical protein SteCoe_29614 [Stentor coeruleus]
MIEYFHEQLCNTSTEAQKYAKSQEKRTRKHILSSLKKEKISQLLKNAWLKKLAKEKKHREIRRYQEQKRFLQRIKEETDALNQEKQEKESKIRAEKEKELQLSKEKLDELKSIRTLMHNEGNKRFFNIKKQKPLFRKIEENFFVNEIVPQRMQYNKSLNERKEFIRSMSIEDINYHEKKYLQELKLSKDSLIEKYRRQKLANVINDNEFSIYKAKIFSIIKAEEEKKAEDERSRELYKKILREKKNQYGNLVQELYSELKLPQNLIKVSPRKVKLKPKMPSSIKILKNDNSLSKSPSKNSPKKPKPEPENKILIQSKSVDYLHQMRILRASSPSKDQNLSISNIKDTLSSIENKPNKLESIINIAQTLEKKTKKLEFLYNTPKISILQSEAISNAYINSIQAKIACLAISKN